MTCHWHDVAGDGGDWVDLSRFANDGVEDDGGIRSPGTSDISMRNQFAAWLGYMTAEAQAEGAAS